MSVIKLNHTTVAQTVSMSVVPVGQVATQALSVKYLAYTGQVS